MLSRHAAALGLAMVLAAATPVSVAAKPAAKQAARPDTPVETATLKLRNTDVLDVVKSLGIAGPWTTKPGRRLTFRARPPMAKGQATQSRGLVPEGIDSIVVLPNKNSLLVQGTEDAVAELTRILRFADVKAEALRLDAQVLRFDFSPDGLEGYRVVSAPRLQTPDRHPCSIRVSGGETGVAIDLTPRANRDGSVVVTGKFQLLDARDRPTQEVSFTRTLRRERGLFVAGVTDSKDPDVIAAATRGLVPQKPGSFTVHLLQLTPRYAGPR